MVSISPIDQLTQTNQAISKLSLRVGAGQHSLTGFVIVMISPSLTDSSLFPGSAAKSYITRACWSGEGRSDNRKSNGKKCKPCLQSTWRTRCLATQGLWLFCKTGRGTAELHPSGGTSAPMDSATNAASKPAHSTEEKWCPSVQGPTKQRRSHMPGSCVLAILTQKFRIQGARCTYTASPWHSFHSAVRASQLGLAPLSGVPRDPSLHKLSHCARGDPVGPAQSWTVQKWEPSQSRPLSSSG